MSITIDDSFDALVQQELRDGPGRDDLMQHLDQWWESLIRTKKRLEYQFGVRALDVIGADEMERAEHRKWRGGALRVLAGVEERLSLIRSIESN